jgi:hypothetical protein
MTDKRLCDLIEKVTPHIQDCVLLYDSESKRTVKMSVANLMGIALNTPCKYCRSRGKYDIRGNCGSCGAPYD